MKSSALIGAASLITMIMSALRSKVVAVFLGPAGVGLLGLFSSATSMVGTLTGMGVATGGVREIADATGAGDKVRVARTVTALRRIVFLLGVAGAVFLAAFSRPISRLTFGNTDHAGTIALLGVTVLAGAVAEGYAASLQGLRRIGDLARVSVVGATVSFALAIPIVSFLPRYAVAALLLSASATALGAAWWYARQLGPVVAPMTWRQTLSEAKPLIQLGIASMSAALMVAAIAYIVRVVIVRYLGFEAAGLYQAATVLSSVYCGFILSAMGADFLPRLSAVSSDDAECNRLVNEQVEVGLLLALPGICATLTFAPVIVELFYSGRFEAATDVLRWQTLGVLLRVASWPMSFLLLAKQKSTLYFWTEVFYNATYAVLLWIGIRIWGLPGAGVAFFLLYVCNSVLMTVVTRRLSGLSWSAANKRVASIGLPIVTFIFVAPWIMPRPWDVTCASMATALVGVFSLKTLWSLPGRQDLQEVFLRRLRALVAVWRPVSGAFKVRHG